MNLNRATLATLAGFLVVAGCASGLSADNTVSGAVVRVIDGDSLRIAGLDPDIRLWGLDAPEWYEEGGPAASVALRNLTRQRVIECDHMHTDKYDRFVGRCRLEDGRDLAAEMIAAGVATEFCFFSKGFYGTC